MGKEIWKNTFRDWVCQTLLPVRDKSLFQPYVYTMAFSCLPVNGIMLSERLMRWLQEAGGKGLGGRLGKALTFSDKFAGNFTALTLHTGGAIQAWAFWHIGSSRPGVGTTPVNLMPPVNRSISAQCLIREKLYAVLANPSLTRHTQLTSPIAPPGSSEVKRGWSGGGGKQREGHGVKGWAGRKTLGLSVHSRVCPEEVPVSATWANMDEHEWTCVGHRSDLKGAKSSAQG